MNKIKYLIKISSFVILILFGIFIFVYGGYDDSPGAQLLGVIVVVLSLMVLIKAHKKFKK